MKEIAQTTKIQTAMAFIVALLLAFVVISVFSASNANAQTCYTNGGVTVISCPDSPYYNDKQGRCFLIDEVDGVEQVREIPCPGTSTSSGDSSIPGYNPPGSSVNADGYLIECGKDESGDPIYVSIDVGCSEEGGISGYLYGIINFLSAGVGVLVVMMVAYGGFEYIIAGSDPQKVQAAKNRIRDAIIALLMYLLLAAFLQWLIPGGII